MHATLIKCMLLLGGGSFPSLVVRVYACTCCGRDTVQRLIVVHSEHTCNRQVALEQRADPVVYQRKTPQLWVCTGAQSLFPYAHTAQ